MKYLVKSKITIKKFVILVAICMSIVFFLFIRLSFQIQLEKVSINEYEVLHDETHQDSTEAQYIIQNIRFIEKILNDEEKSSSSKKEFKPPKFLVLLVQVHSRVKYLKELINSLRETKFINESLVVFSHDLKTNEMDDLIRSIDFCAVSLQLKKNSIC